MALKKQQYSDEEIANRSRSNVKRQKQRERQKRAKEHADRELAELRQQNDALLRRVSAIEGNTLASNVSAIDQRIAQAQADVKQAEVIIARAVEAGNGDDVATAMRLREEAHYEAQQLWQQKQQVEQVRQQHANPALNRTDHHRPAIETVVKRARCGLPLAEFHRRNSTMGTSRARSVTATIRPTNG